MRWTWRDRGSRFLEQRRGKLQELDEAKEILGEVFGIDRYEVDEMIRMRLDECPACDQKLNQS